MPVGTDRYRGSRPVNVIWDNTASEYVPPPECDQMRFALRNHRLQDECCGLPVSNEEYAVPAPRYTVYRASYVNVIYV